MYIKNLKTKVIQECQNNDIIKICKKHPDEYHVAENIEDIPEEGKELSTMKVEELKALAATKGIEGTEKMKKDELIELLKDVV